MSPAIGAVFKAVLLLAICEQIACFNFDKSIFRGYIPGPSGCDEIVGVVTMCHGSRPVIKCLGSVYISPETKRVNVLTDPRCVQGHDVNQVFAIAAISKDESQVVNISKITIHPEYNSSTFENSIAILHLDGAFASWSIGAFKPGNLPEKDISDDETYCKTYWSQYRLIIPPKNTPHECFQRKSENVFPALVDVPADAPPPNPPALGSCLAHDGKLVGIYKANFKCMGPDGVFQRMTNHTNVFKYKDWIIANSSYLPEPRVFLVLAASVTYFMRFLF